MICMKPAVWIYIGTRFGATIGCIFSVLAIDFPRSNVSSVESLGGFSLGGGGWGGINNFSHHKGGP
jgi:hypothetical protein